MNRKRSKKWRFTLNNPVLTPEEVLELLRLKVVYTVFQLEEGKNKTPHYQGYINLKRTQRFSYVKKILPRANWLKADAGDIANTAYCSKTEGRIKGPWKIGTPVFPGKRTDLAKLKQRVQAGERLSTVINDCSNFQQIRFTEKLHGYQSVSHTYKKKEVNWLYGDTGTGKTKKAYQTCPEGDTYHCDTSKWFDGYDGQKYAIIDEIRAKNWSYDSMLKLLDGYDRRVPVKGGFTIWKPEIVYITGPLSPQATYGGTLEHHGSIDQLLRRLTSIKECTKEGSIFVYSEIK